MGGEVGLDIKEVIVDNIVYPYNSFDGSRISVDLTLRDDKDGFFHICGDNDWGYFALEMLEPIHKEADCLINDVKNRLSKIGDRPEVIMIG